MIGFLRIRPNSIGVMARGEAEGRPIGDYRRTLKPGETFLGQTYDYWRNFPTSIFDLHDDGSIVPIASVDQIPSHATAAHRS